MQFNTNTYQVSILTKKKEKNCPSKALEDNLQLERDWE